MVLGQISIAYILAYILIDFGASHSFVATSFVMKLDLVLEFLIDVCNISLPSYESMRS